MHFCRILKDGEQPLFLDTLIFSRHPFAPLLLRMYLQADSKLDLLCKLSVLSCPRPSMEGAVKSRAMCSLFGSLNLKKCWRHIVGAPLGTWGSCCSTSPFASYVGFAPQVHGRVLRVPLGAALDSTVAQLQQRKSRYLLSRAFTRVYSLLPDQDLHLSFPTSWPSFHTTVAL